MSKIMSLPVVAAMAVMLAIACLSFTSVAEARGGGGKSSGPSMMRSASFKPMHHHHHHRQWRHYGYSSLVVVAPSYSCDHYWSMWKRTGNLHWRTKYHVCIG